MYARRGQLLMDMAHLIIMGLMAIPISLSAQVKIKMQKDGDVYTLPCTVNGLQLRFILDTGASDVSISLSEAAFMLKNGYLDAKDIKGTSSIQIANGSIVSPRHVRGLYTEFRGAAEAAREAV